jgi:hypothetical protein
MKADIPWGYRLFSAAASQVVLRPLKPGRLRPVVADKLVGDAAEVEHIGSGLRVVNKLAGIVLSRRFSIG